MAFAASAATPAAGYQADGDHIDAPLTDKPGNPERGRMIVANRQLSACLLCHSGPFADPHLQGTIGPSLAGIGSRLTAGEIRLRLVDPRLINPDTIMPGYYSLNDLHRVGAAWEGKTILSAEQIEDVIAYLMTLRTP